jgi:hypothetical protein
MELTVDHSGVCAGKALVVGGLIEAAVGKDGG